MSAETGVQSTNRLVLPKSSTPSSPPSSGGVELPFQSNEPVGHQSSPPHSYRHSRAYRHFKNPPQPHMCIRVTTVNGEELFINVLSWTRIVIPQEPSDPIPLYGGMRVPPGSPRSPPLVYAVMANPEVLKDSGRHSKDPEERGAMVELMCDFVEAMNPDIKLTRNAVILKDRDISGELKDVWNAVQAQRDREREEQLTQQHQQQQYHYHNLQPQQIYLPKTPQQSQSLQQQKVPQFQGQQIHLQAHNNNLTPTTTDNKILHMECGSAEVISSGEHNKDYQLHQQKLQENNMNEKNTSTLLVQSAINNTEANSNNKDRSPTSVTDINKKLEMNGKDVTDCTRLTMATQSNSSNSNNATNNSGQVNNLQSNVVNNQQLNHSNTGLQQVSGTTINKPAGLMLNTTNITTTTTTITTTTNTNTKTASNNSVTTTPTTNSVTTNTTTVTKKEKLGGFLPNGCHSIFPRFKNHKHKDKEKDKDKDKDKEKDKESKSNHSKEKTLLNSFKKSTTAAANAFNKSQQDDTKPQYEKNCLNLDNEVEKLDLNKIDSPANEVLIKLKVASSGAK